MPNGGFIVVNDDVLNHPDIKTCFEALLVSLIDRYPQGCWLSSSQIGRFLMVDPRTVQRTVKDLLHRDWLYKDYAPGNQRPTLHATIKPLPPGKLFEQSARKVAQELRADRCRK